MQQNLYTFYKSYLDVLGIDHFTSKVGGLGYWKKKGFNFLGEKFYLSIQKIKIMILDFSYYFNKADFQLKILISVAAEIKQKLCFSIKNLIQIKSKGLPQDKNCQRLKISRLTVQRVTKLLTDVAIRFLYSIFLFLHREV